MTDIDSSNEKELTPKQQMLIAALVAGNTIAVAAAAADISEKTAYVWLKQPSFKKEYKAAKQAVFDESLDALKDGIHLAIETLKRNMTDAAPYVQVQAAHIWLEAAIEVHKMSELESRITELEEMVKASHG